MDNLQLQCDSLTREKATLEHALQMAAEACKSSQQTVADHETEIASQSQEVKLITTRLRKLCHMAEQHSTQAAPSSAIGESWEQLLGLLEFR